MSMKVLVTGATGFVGHEVTRLLKASGHTPRLLVRDPSSRKLQDLVPGFATELHTGDVLDPGSLTPALAGCDAAIHLVGIISEVGRQTFERLHCDATLNVVAAAKQAGVKRFLHMSALGTRPSAPSRYHQTKWAAEQAVRGSGLDWTIFRPSIIYGPSDGFVNLFARLSKLSPIVPLIGGGKARFQPIPVEDVARCFVGALNEPGSIGQTFDVCGMETLTLSEIVDAILQVTNRVRVKLPLPFAVANAQAACAEFFFNQMLGKAPPLNRDQVTMLRADNVGEGELARKLFGLSPRGFREGIAEYLRRKH
jgi:NADH dehydrogenase